MKARRPRNTLRAQPRHGGAFRKAGVADPAPLLVGADEVSRAAKVLAAARKAAPSKEERSAWVWRHVAALEADIARRLAARSTAHLAPEPPEAQPDRQAGK
jgi:hypothetical protein